MKTRAMWKATVPPPVRSLLDVLLKVCFAAFNKLLKSIIK